MLIFVKIDFFEIFFLEKIRDSYHRKRVGKISLKSGLSVEIAHFFVLIQEVLQIEKTKMYINKVQCRKLISIVQACK